MNQMDDSIVSEFLAESGEGLSQVEEDLLALERNPSDPARLARVFRAIHTVKGTCGFFGFSKLESVAHAGESLLSRLRAGEIALNAEISGALFALVDALREILANIEKTRQEGDGDYGAIIATLTRLQGEVAEPETAATSPSPAAPQSPAAPPSAPAPAEPAPPKASVQASERGTIGGGLLDPLIRSGRLDPEAVMLAAQQQRLGDPRRIGEILVDHGAVSSQEILEALIARGEGSPSAATEGNIRVDVQLLDLLMNLVGELVLARNQMLQFVSSQNFERLPATTQRLNSITTELQEGIMKTRMQPIANLCKNLPRLVRDVAAACGKQARLEMEGIDTELDRTIIDAIRDPLTHLVRNAVDHGLESREARLAAGKPAEGRLTVTAFHEGGKVNIEVSDDGAGLPLERIRERAIQAGLIPPERVARMTERDWHQVIFVPGFSTAEKVTHVSGRGVGMDVVKTNVERIGGTIDVDSMPGRGTTVKIRIPLTLAIIPALIVTAGGDRYAIPQVSLIELVRVDGGEDQGTIARVFDAQVYRYRDSLLPLLFLRDTLKIEGPNHAGAAASEGTALNIAVLQSEGVSFGLVVDEINASQEIVVKPLAEAIKNTAVFSGATILGDGRVALILDIPGLARHAGIAAVGEAEPAGASAPIESAPRDATRTLLLFRVRDLRVAIPLEMVARLEEIPRGLVERAGEHEVVQYRGGIMPLHRLLDLLEPGAAAPEAKDDRLRVVVHERDSGSMGLVVDELLGLVEEAPALQRIDGRPGVVGSAVIRGRVTDLLDIPELLAAAALHPPAAPVGAGA